MTRDPTQDPELTSLDQLLKRICEAGGDSDRVAIDSVVKAVGRRSFGPLILIGGLIAFSPLSGIPGIPTTVAVMVGLVAFQMICGRKHFWLPQWVLRRSIPRKRFEKAVHWVRPAARRVDRLLQPRLSFLTNSVGAYAMAILSALIALAMPPTELIPFAATLAGAALMTFGLALIAHDGLVALLALMLTAGIVVVAVRSLL